MPNLNLPRDWARAAQKTGIAGSQPGIHDVYIKFEMLGAATRAVLIVEGRFRGKRSHKRHRGTCAGQVTATARRTSFLLYKQMCVLWPVIFLSYPNLLTREDITPSHSRPTDSIQTHLILPDFSLLLFLCCPWAMLLAPISTIVP